MLEEFWEDTGLEESEEIELKQLTKDMRRLMAKRSQCASGSEKQEQINNDLEKIYQRRSDLMNKDSLTEDSKGSEVLQSLEDINTETEINERYTKCDKAEYDVNAGKITCDGEEVSQDDALEEDSLTNAESLSDFGSKLGAKAGQLIGKGLDKAKEWGSKSADVISQEFSKARTALHNDVANSGLTEEAEKDPNEECIFRVNKRDGSNEYIVVESSEKFANYIAESFSDIVSFEKIDTEALNESMDQEIVDSVVVEVSKNNKTSMDEIQNLLSDMVDETMSEEFVKTIYKKIVNRLTDAGIEIAE